MHIIKMPNLTACTEEMHLTLSHIVTLAALVEPAAVGGRLEAVGVVALGTGLFLLVKAVVGEGRLAELASPFVERVDGRDLEESGLVEPALG